MIRCILTFLPVLLLLAFQDWSRDSSSFIYTQGSPTGTQTLARLWGEGVAYDFALLSQP